jgi:hypothetical protein
VDLIVVGLRLVEAVVEALETLLEGSVEVFGFDLAWRWRSFERV